MTPSTRGLTIALVSAAMWLALAPSLMAQTTVNQQDRTARILSDGTIEAGGGWLTVSHTAGSAVYTLNFTDPFTAPPNCVVSGDAISGSQPTHSAPLGATLDAAQSLNTITVHTATHTPSGSFVNQDGAFRIHCKPDTNVGLSAASWSAAGALLSGSDWIASVTRISPGRYVLVFRRPYLSVPNCVASPSAIGNPGATIQVNANTTSMTIFVQSLTQPLALLLLTQADHPGSVMCSGPQ